MSRPFLIAINLSHYRKSMIISLMKVLMWRRRDDVAKHQPGSQLLPEQA